MGVSERISELMKKRGISQNRLAKAAQISQSGLSAILSGAVSPKETTLNAIAEALGVPVIDLYVERSGYVSYDSKTDRYYPVAADSISIRRNAVPVIGNIACSPQTAPDVNADGYADLPDGVRADFALRCKGDSMSPMFNDGDLVLIRRQPEVENGQVAAVSINGETTLKHVYKTENGLLLFANNTKYEPIQVKPDDDVTVYGLAVGYVRMF